MFKSWSDKDWKWLVCILIGGIIVILSHWFVGMENDNVLNYISFMATGVSTVLAIVAIGISISQNENSSHLNVRMNSTIERMDEKLNGVKDSITNGMTPVRKERNDESITIEKGQSHNISRLHGVINTMHEWDGKEFLKYLDRNLKKINNSYNIIDYSIMPLEKSMNIFFKYSTNISLIFDDVLDDRILEGIIENTFDDIGVSNRESHTYFNSNI